MILGNVDDKILTSLSPLKYRFSTKFYEQLWVANNEIPVMRALYVTCAKKVQ